VDLSQAITANIGADPELINLDARILLTFHVVKDVT
jgi:hypothetical protein